MSKVAVKTMKETGKLVKWSQTDRQTDIDRQTGRQTDRQTDRQTKFEQRKIHLVDTRMDSRL